MGLFSGIGAALSVVGALKGSKDQNDAADDQNEVSLANLEETKRANLVREKLGQEQFDLSKAPVVSGTGSRSEFIDGRGFITTLSPMERTLQDSNLQRMIREGPGQEARRNAEDNAGFRRRLETGAAADSVVKGVDDLPSNTNRSILGALRLQHRGANDAAAQPGLSAAANALLSKGDIGAGRAFSDIQQQLAKNNRTNEPSRLDADQLAEGENASRQAEQGNLLALLTSLANPNSGTAQPIPNPQDNTTAIMQRLIPQSAGVAINSVNPSLQAPPVTSFGTSNLLNAGASALFGYDQQQQAARDRQQLLSLMSNRGTSSGNFGTDDIRGI